MDKKKQEIKNNYQKRLDEQIGGVEVFSKDHKVSAQKFNRLLDTMQKTQKNKAEKMAILGLKQITDELLKFLGQNNLTLSESEKRELTVITGSGFDPIVKKRMAEDLAHKSRKRCEKEKEFKFEKKKNEKEIKQLLSSKNIISKWFQLTKFAFEFSTISIISHRFLDSCISTVRSRIHVWLNNIEISIGDVLDNKYYILSNMEYNSLQKLLSLRGPVNKILNLPRENSYDPKSMSGAMNEFSKIYVTIIKNSDIIETAIKKIMKTGDKKHGLWGDIKNILDEPINNNRPIKWTKYNRMTQSILGMLLSYHTARRGIIIRSIIQVMYLVDTDGAIESNKKILTEKAVEVEKEKRTKMDSEKEDVENRFDNLGIIIKKHLKNGLTYEDMLYKTEGKTRYKSWVEEHEKNPLIRIKRLVEIFIKYIIENINKSTGFKLDYDKNEFINYFSDHSDLIKLTTQYNMIGFELVGSKIKDFTSQSFIPDKDPDSFIKLIIETEKPKISGYNFIRKVLLDIGNKSYQVADKLNKIILDYYRNREIINNNTMRNYNFYINAQLKRSKQINAPAMFKKESISLRAFLEAGCSLAFHIARIVHHPGIDAILAERDQLGEELKKDDQPELIGEDIAGSKENEEVEDELDQMYNDTLTGLKRKSYFDEVLMRQSYDSRGIYRGKLKRFIFLAEIFSLKGFNDKYSHEIGDKIVLSFARSFYDRIIHDSHKENIIIRYSGAEILGFIHDVSLTGAVEMVSRAVKNIMKIRIEHKGDDTGQIPVSAAIYEERGHTDFLDNFSNVSRILSTVAREGVGSIGFIKKADYVVSKRDYNSMGIIDKGILAVIKLT